MIDLIYLLLKARKVSCSMQSNTFIIDGKTIQSDDITLVSNWSELDIDEVERTFILNTTDNVKSKNKEELPLKYSIIYKLKNKNLASISFYYKGE